jgi:ElaB/YqjD/DUF883 family membrane-anchored ribosome-binding protein
MKMSMPSQFVEGASEAVDNAIDQIDRRSQEVHDEFADKAHDVVNKSKPTMERWAKDAESAARRGIDAASDATHRLRDRAARTTDSTVDYIKDEPVKAMLIAAAAGAALVTLMGLIHRSRARD